MTSILTWLDTSTLAAFIRESTWGFPTIESIHVIAISLVIGTIAILDLRLLGIGSTRRPVTELCGDLLPWTWVAFVIAAITGGLLFISQATQYFQNTTFRVKMLFMLLAGVNMLIFEFITYRNVSNWDCDTRTAISGKLAGAISLTCWFAVAVCGRWLGFTMLSE